MRILILTHNILNERVIQEGLQQFNFEVFVSKTILDMILYTEQKCDLDFFSIVILSESLSSKDVKRIVPVLKKTRIAIFRKYLGKPFNKELKDLNELQINEWIDNSISIESLRDLISKYNLTSLPIILEQNNQLISMTFDQLVRDFTKTQKKCFINLYNANGSILSREELCQGIWDSTPTKSNLSHLSGLIKGIRQKLVKKGFPPEVVETVWGDGYILKEEFYCIYRESSSTNNNIHNKKLDMRYIENGH